MARITVIAALLLMPVLAFAHRPYAISHGTIESPSGAPLIKERLHGDGIFLKDPVAFQLRSRNGTVLAASPRDFHVATFCPSIHFCWAFPYGHWVPVRGWYLDVSAVDFDRGTGHDTTQSLHADDDEKEFQAYLAGTSDFFVSFALEWPGNQLTGTETAMGFVRSDWSLLLSPLVVILDQWMLMVFVVFIMCTLFALKALSKRCQRIESKWASYTLQFLVALLFVSLFLSSVILLSAAVFMYAVPIYILGVSIGLGAWLVVIGRKIAQRYTDSDPALTAT